ncbi:hypothetical protein M1N11_04185 [Peptococcaceae bacterium]|nr:hypothetical protein [Peptococcaceae bacterium]MCL0077888.1 hypothetical protein [Peptococcaceae bacterium]
MVKVKKIENILYPEIFGTQHIYAYNKFNEELKEIIENSGYKREFIRKYRKCLKFLEKLKENCIKQKSFERLSSYENIYSMRFMGEKNIRILFTFIEENKKKFAVLLCAFQEKDNKNKSKYSYNNAVKVAQKRIKEILE